MKRIGAYHKNFPKTQDFVICVAECRINISFFDKQINNKYIFKCQSWFQKLVFREKNKKIN